MRSSFSMSLLYHAYVYLEFLILACTIYILASTVGGAVLSLFLFVTKELYGKEWERTGKVKMADKNVP